ncbi:PucR-like helix-turn-helix protein [Tamaricihabitans halophyticus]|uniref:PucR-like helix-turn-helix protein n=1 Tax=Tamaricihabitans halophyticus TaxID=1262583 RepID=A0A4R2QGV4_9PSEU|nr:helix-turn-helix domain-containing protein [Tamaricihabitans halophyticus]TCP48462.1 PucR-like helix-turn-helix protein [Tamaricihabitans halophyticus]
MRPELQDIVDDVSRLLSAPTTLEDRDFHLVAFGSQAAVIDRVRQESILQRRCSPEAQAWFEQFGIATSEQPVRTPADDALGVLPRVCLPARWHGVTYGYLWLLDEHRLLEDTLLVAAMHRAARAGAVMAQQARAREDLQDTVQDLLATDTTTVEAAADRIAELGALGRHVELSAVVLRLAGPRPRTVPMNLWRLPRSVVAAPADDHTTLLVPGESTAAVRIAEQAWRLHADRLTDEERAGLVAGVGAPVADLAAVRASWRQASLAVRAAHAVSAVRPVAVWSELGVYRLLGCEPRQRLAEAVLDAPVRRLLRAEPELVRTASSYLDNAGHVQRTAAALGIHRQTLYYRLQKIERLTGFDLADGQHRLRLHLGLTMAPVLPDGVKADGVKADGVRS